ncbi:alpha/beta hydrolase [Aeromonas veronii]|uniref:alpha/beta hydrolase n=1 Tax=Aeromonas veronii TaxID=654 RepID=UPI0009B85E7F|nr:alpha/beta hydrolase [Aeromonas veronii]MBM0417057.1 alpha/beta hydrolase [Aeromonas veronii]MBW3787947.1 alpha/beta hydrolase [Aeromonas veronii]
MNTQEIIRYVAGHFSRENGIPLIKFSDWLNIYRTWERLSPSISEVGNLIPLRDPVVKLIYKEIYSTMPFDRDYVLKKYEYDFEGIQYLVYPSRNTEKLVVLLSGYSERKTYNRYSWFWDEAEKWEGNTTYLFLNDIENTWYCGHGDDKAERYKKIILRISSQYNISNKQIFVVGGSMGGYGAFRLGLDLDVGGVISINPQTSHEAVSLHNDPSWLESINKCGDKFISVPDLINKSLPAKIYLECGNYCSDVFDLESISRCVSKKGGVFILNHHSSEKHVTLSPNKIQLETIISIFSEDVISNSTAEENCAYIDGSF